MITKINDNLYRGPRPTKEMILELQALGVKTLIDLESGIYEKFHNDSYKYMDLAKYNMIEHDVPCSDIFPPDISKIADVFLILSVSKSPTYIHCLQGKDRTGFICAIYRMQNQKWSYKDAVAEMWSMGFHWFYFYWLLALKKYEVKK